MSHPEKNLHLSSSPVAGYPQREGDTAVVQRGTNGATGSTKWKLERLCGNVFDDALPGQALVTKQTKGVTTLIYIYRIDWGNTNRGSLKVVVLDHFYVLISKAVL